MRFKPAADLIHLAEKEEGNKVGGRFVGNKIISEEQSGLVMKLRSKHSASSGGEAAIHNATATGS